MPQEALFKSGYRKKFIFLDLETTHLDMREGKIMEVGAVEAELFIGKTGVGVKFGKAFSTLINPEIEPSETALMLTGIATEDLAKASLWNEVKEELQDFLGDAVLVGHNLSFDLGYLQNQGLTLKNKYLDTLEVAQTLLPLADSHSLEYLAESLGVLKGVSHRALADSQNTAQVLAAVLNEFLTFPKILKTEILELFAGSQLAFAQLIMDLPEISLPRGKKQPVQAFQTVHGPSLDLAPNTVISLPLAFTKQEQVLKELANRKEQTWVAVSHDIHLSSLPEEVKIPNPAWALCDKRLATIKSQANLSDLARKIFIKIAIFRQFSGSLDLSQIKWNWTERDSLGVLTCVPEICQAHGCDYTKLLEGRIPVVRFSTLETIFALVHDWQLDLAKQKLLLLDLSSIEEEFTENSSQTLNLRKLRGRLAQIYPIDERVMSFFSQTPKEVELLANEIDLFFGILHLVYLKREGSFAQNLIVAEGEITTERFQKLIFPAKKLATKLQEFSKHLGTRILLEPLELRLELKNLQAAIQRAAEFLNEFFVSPEDEQIYWLKFNDTWVDLSRVPRNLQENFRDFIKKFETVSILETSLPSLAFSYFQRRLGLENFLIQTLPSVTGTRAITVKLLAKPASFEQSASFLRSLPGKSLAVLPNETTLKEYFTALVKNKTSQEVLAYKYSGNISMLRAKATKPIFLLLLTTNALLRYWPNLPELDNLVVFRVPFEASGSRPSLFGIDPRDSFPSHVLPRAVNLLHRMVARFLAANSGRRAIFILDPRVLNDYDQTFLNYFAEFPDFQTQAIDNLPGFGDKSRET